VDAVFYGWNDTWLRPDFRDWNILAEIARVRAPVLAILGEGDEYATPVQVAAIEKSLPRGTRFESLVLADCGHAPHRDQPGAVLQAVKRFVAAL
jgi:pimeloyl-ACP methyl ester carboxylesterase